MDAPISNAQSPRSPVPKPANVDFQLDFDALNMKYRWRSTRCFLLLAVCILWDGFLVVWYSLSSHDTLWNTIVTLLGAALGIWLAYYTFAAFLNHTVITVNLQWLAITHGPLPWFGNKRIEITRINQLYAEEVRSPRGVLKQLLGYRLSAVLRDKQRVKLLGSLPSADIAHFVEQSVEEYLHIEDRPVVGEMSKYYERT